MKRVIESGQPTISTYYSRDAQGNVMAVYTRETTTGESSADTLYLSEQHIYGSNRLGYVKSIINMTEVISTPDSYSRVLGEKSYELSNHLGNVLVVVSDRRLAIQGSGATAGKIKNFEPDVLSAQDYDPFGMITFGRSWEAGSEYRYGFNGKENTNEIYGSSCAIDFGARLYDPRLGIWLSVDSDFSRYPSYSPYNFCLNSPLYYKDQNGKGAVITVIEEPGKAPYLLVTTYINIYNDALGASGTNELATIAIQIKNDIETAYNNPFIFDASTGTFTQTKATTQYENTTVEVVFNVVVNVVSDAQAIAAIDQMDADVAKQTANIDGVNPQPDPRISGVSQNYVKIEHANVGSSMPGGNSGTWMIEQNINSGNTTWLEEFGHMLGWTDKELGYKGRIGNGSTGLVQDPIHANPDELSLGYPFSIMSRPFLNETSGTDPVFLENARIVLTTDIANLNGGSGLGSENESPTLNNFRWRRNALGQKERIIGPATTTKE